MSREQYLQNVTIGPVALHNQRIYLSPYDKNWPILFRQEAKKILKVLGHKAQFVEHVGSTSVPFLAAKPILDILLLVPNSSQEKSYVAALETIGYTLRIREPEWFEHRMLKKNEPRVHLHVFSTGCEEAKRMLIFRDWLRTHDEDRNLYEKTKQELARQQWKYVQDYADAKTKVIQKILQRAYR